VAAVLVGTATLPAIISTPVVARASAREPIPTTSTPPTDAAEILFQVELKYASTAKPLPTTVETKLKALLRTAGVQQATITSTTRAPADQARAMYTNLARRGGVAKQRQLYGPSGDSVIDTYEAEKAKGKSRAKIEAAMAAKIVAVGPGKVSLHCAGSGYDVVDIAPSSVSAKSALVKVLEEAVKKGDIQQFLHPGNSSDPAYHIAFES